MKPTLQMRNNEVLRSQLRKVRRYSVAVGLICAIAYVPFFVREGFDGDGGLFFVGAVCGLIGALPIRSSDPGSKRYNELFDMSRSMLFSGLLFLLSALVLEALRALGLV